MVAVGIPTMETVWKILKKLKIEIVYGPTIPFLDIYHKKMKNTNLKKNYVPPPCSLKYFIYNSQDRETT